MEEIRKKEKIKACIAISIIVLAMLVVGIICIKYSVEGETDMPYSLSKITIVSTAEGVENPNSEEKWNLSVYQNNDIYFSIEKKQDSEDNQIIKNISIENIEIVKQPSIGNVKAYMPNSGDGRLFSYAQEYILQDNKITFNGSKQSNNKTLEIGNQGGTAVIRISNTELGNYISNNQDEEIQHDGTLISKIEKGQEDINFEVKFDFIINTQNKSYISNISLKLPCENDLIEKGTVSKEITDGIIFRRLNK